MSFQIIIPSHIEHALERAPNRVQSRLRVHLSAAAVLAAKNPPPAAEWMNLLYGVSDRELVCEVDNYRLRYTCDMEQQTLRVIALVERRGGNEITLQEDPHHSSGNGNGRHDPSSGSPAQN